MDNKNPQGVNDSIQQSSLTQPEINNQKSNKKKKVLIILAIVLLFLILTPVTIFLYVARGYVFIPSIESARNWETYSSKTFGFSFQYPADYFQYSCAIDDLDDPTSWGFNLNCFSNQYWGQPSDALYVTAASNKYVTPYWVSYDQLQQEYNKAKHPPGKNTEYYIYPKKLSVNGQDWYSFLDINNNNNSYGPISDDYVAFTRRKDFDYEVQVQSNKGKTYFLSHVSYFERIVKSIRFTGKPKIIQIPLPSPTPTPNEDTSNWQTLNTTNGYSLKYPPNFYIDTKYALTVFIRSSQSKTYAVGLSRDIKLNSNESIEDFISNEYFIQKISLSNYKTKSTTIDNHPAYFLEIKQGDQPNDYLQDFMFIQQDTSHIIILQSFSISKGDTDPNKILFNQILSTVKFVDQNQATSISPTITQQCSGQYCIGCIKNQCGTGKQSGGGCYWNSANNGCYPTDHGAAIGEQCYYDSQCQSNTCSNSYCVNNTQIQSFSPSPTLTPVGM